MFANQPNYSFNEHKHRYSIWTAARAVQRSFTTTAAISQAIDKSGIRAFAESSDRIGQDEFDLLHSDRCNKIIGYFNKVETPCSYGRAAKMISIYLKTSYILPSKGEGSNCSVIHPPLDRILLTALAKDDLAFLKKEAWTGWDEKRYREVVAEIKKVYTRFDWTLESLWTPEREVISDTKKLGTKKSSTNLNL